MRSIARGCTTPVDTAWYVHVLPVLEILQTPPPLNIIGTPNLQFGSLSVVHFLLGVAKCTGFRGQNGRRMYLPPSFVNKKNVVPKR